MKINIDIARKVLSTIDAGLVSGVGEPEPGKMCVEAAVCYALGLPHGDNPQCVARSLRAINIRLNDSQWSSSEARAKGLRRLGIAQLGSAGVLDETELARRVCDLALRVLVPAALRAASSIHQDAQHRAALYAAADKCAREASRSSAAEARDIARAARGASSSDAAADAADAAASAADAAASAADAAADAAALAAAAAAAAAYAAYYAEAAKCPSTAAAKRDEALAQFAEEVVQILISMDAPGCQWLHLTETD